MQPLLGVKVVEVTTFGFVPSGVALLADWGADVITIEHPRVPDPMRGLTTVPAPDGRIVDYVMDHFNRGKRNLALDLATEPGRDVLHRLVRQADAFVTSFLPPAQRKLGITYEDLKAVNPSLVYAHGHGYGPRGPDSEQPGFDGISYWCRGGVGHALTFKDGPPAGQRPAFGDVMGGLSVAAGVSAALHRRTTTGEGCAVDVSLLAVACWQLAPDIMASSVSGLDVQMPAPGPDSGPFRTSDGRYVTVLLLLPQYLGNVLRALDREDLLDNPLFANYPGGVAPPGSDVVNAALREAIGSLTVDEVRRRFTGQEIAWSVVQTPAEVLSDPQVQANEYVLPNPSKPGELLVSGPIQFDRAPPRPPWGSPRQGEHTEAILREVGLDDTAVKELLEAGVVAQGSEGVWDEYGRLTSPGR
jgi:crotonobetainyl-CoA:carnitine CoA-transferase CaiB-like acyl-CoA transferase